jgi:MFS family permease
MDTLRKWAVIVVAIVATAVVIGIVLPGIALWSPHWRAEFGAGSDQVMAATTFNQIGSALFAPFVGYAVGRIAVRTMMLAGVFLTAAALAGVAYSTAMWQVTLLHTVALSAGVVLCGPVLGQVLAVRLFQENRGLAIGAVTTGASFSTFTMPPLIGWLLESGYGWREVELIMAAIVLALAPLVFFIVRESPAALADDDAPETVPAPTKSAGEILTGRPFIAILLTLIPIYVVFNAIYYTLGFFLADLGATPGQTAGMIGLMGFISLFAVVAFGALADRMSQWTLLAISTVVLTVAFGVVATAQSYGLLLLVLPVLGFTVGGLLSLGPAMFAKFYGSADFARAGGLSQPFFTISAFAPFLAGYLRDEMGAYSGVYLLMMLALPVSYVGLILLRMPGGMGASAKVAPAG